MIGQNLRTVDLEFLSPNVRDDLRGDALAAMTDMLLLN
jgi:hypothetical protein